MTLSRNLRKALLVSASALMVASVGGFANVANTNANASHIRISRVHHHKTVKHLRKSLKRTKRNRKHARIRLHNVKRHKRGLRKRNAKLGKRANPRKTTKQNNTSEEATISKLTNEVKRDNAKVVQLTNEVNAKLRTKRMTKRMPRLRKGKRVVVRNNRHATKRNRLNKRNKASKKAVDAIHNRIERNEKNDVKVVNTKTANTNHAKAPSVTFGK